MRPQIPATPAAPAINPLESRHILLLNSYHQRMTWVKDIVGGVEDVLRTDENNLSLKVITHRYPSFSRSLLPA